MDLLTEGVILGNDSRSQDRGAKFMQIILLVSTGTSVATILLHIAATCNLYVWLFLVKYHAALCMAMYLPSHSVPEATFGGMIIWYILYMYCR